MTHMTLNWLAAVFQLVGFAATAFGAIACAATLGDLTELVEFTAEQGGLALAGTYWSVLVWLAPVLVGLLLLGLGGVLRVAQQHGEWVAAGE